jgi:hypothetical protein
MQMMSCAMGYTHSMVELLGCTRCASLFYHDADRVTPFMLPCSCPCCRHPCLNTDLGTMLCVSLTKSMHSSHKEAPPVPQGSPHPSGLTRTSPQVGRTARTAACASTQRAQPPGLTPGPWSGVQTLNLFQQQAGAGIMSEHGCMSTLTDCCGTCLLCPGYLGDTRSAGGGDGSEHPVQSFLSSS